MKVRIKQMIPILLFFLMIMGILFGIRPMIVMSGSMEPEIQTGSLCFVNHKTPMEKVEEGDIITYSLLDAKITHRVVEKKEQGMLTKGDANPAMDLGIVTKETYYGKVIGHIPKLGYVLFFLKKNLIPISMIVILSLLLPWKDIYLWFTEKEEMKGGKN